MIVHVCTTVLPGIPHMILTHTHNAMHLTHEFLLHVRHVPVPVALSGGQDGCFMVDNERSLRERGPGASQLHRQTGHRPGAESD